MLIAQTSDNSSFRKLLEVSRLGNEAYAKLKGFDYVAMIGMYKGFRESHAAFNKIFLLNELIEKYQQQYHIVIYLDADAVIVNSSLEPKQILAPLDSSVLAACTWFSEPPWNINNGVMFWNLRHSQSRVLARTWLDAAWREMWAGGTDDQAPLQRLLQSWFGTWRQSLLRIYTGADFELFNYRGRYIEHVLRAEDGMTFRTDSIAARVSVLRQILLRCNITVPDSKT